jgi:hypothetical protein
MNGIATRVAGNVGWSKFRPAAREKVSVEALLVLLSALLALALLPASALAGTLATPVALDAPDNGNTPLVAYAPDGYTYVAWSAPDNQNNGNGVDLCVLPPNATACEGGGPVLLTDTNQAALGTNSSNTVGLGGLVVLPGTGEVVVLGTPVETGTVAWASPPGGAAFLTGDNGLQDGGNFISPVSLFYTTNNAAPIDGTDVAIFDSYDHFYSYFSDSPFTGPETPSSLPENQGNANNGGQFDDQGDEIGPVIAAEPAPAPAPAGTYIVVGAGANVSSNEATPPGCVNDAATGYGVDVGTPGPGGTLNSQGLQPNGFGLLACSAEGPVLASGGGAGIGVFEQEGSGVSGAGSDWNLDWRPFDATASGGSFGGPVELADDTNDALNGADNLDASEDTANGVYVSWEDEQGLVLDYSSDSGKSWDGPVIAPTLPGANGQGSPAIAGVGNGTVLVASAANIGTGEQVFLQAVNLIPPPTVASSATSNGKSVTVTVSCAATPCTVTITITIDPPAVMAGAARKGKKPKPRIITLGKGTFTIRHAGKNKLSVKLTSKGKSFLKSHHHPKAKIVVTNKSTGKATTGSLRINLKLSKHHKK